jgi:diguanylate cyclase (GGDEF)-like protein
VLLGFGAPLGAYALRLLSGHTTADELRIHSFFYLYELIGTSLVFALYGFYLGRRADRLRRERDNLLDVSQHDELTGLLNTRAFWQRYRRATESSDVLALLMIDVDQFKAINDAEGHRFGDEALRHIARAITAATREQDAAARWGGDEFAVLMRGTDRATAINVAERIRARVGEKPVRLGNAERPVSVTIGLAVAAPGGGAGLFDRADHALYEGKHLSRDRLQVAEESVAPLSAIERGTQRQPPL